MRLSRSIFWMAAFLLAVIGVGVWLAVRLKSAFMANPYLNGVLIAVWLIGIIYIFAQTLRLRPEIRWVHAVQRSRLAVNELDPPPLMGSLARLMEDRDTPLILTPTALRAVLDGIAVRLDESREIARYFTGLMIFLGLLGTFWGLLKTVGSVGGVVNGLSMTADPTELFNTLKMGLQGPLTGMGTAFGSSLLGLAGSLVLGFLDLQMGQAQNRFFIGLEDWLFASARDERETVRDTSPAAALQKLVDQTAANIDRFHQIMVEGDEGRRQTAGAIQRLAEAIASMIDGQNRDRAAQTRSAQAMEGHLSAIAADIQRMVEAQEQIRTQTLEETRREIARLARSIGITAGPKTDA